MRLVKTDIRVIYGDTDQMGVVYYGNYLRYFEAGRTEYLRAVGICYRDVESQFQVFLPVVEAHASYHKPARFDDLLSVETVLDRVGRASARFAYRVLRDGIALASGHTLHACVDRAGSVTPLPAELAARLRTNSPA